MTPAESQIYYAAWHEAGHCICALKLGLRVTRATVRPDGSGFACVPALNGPDLDARAAAIVSAGGCAATTLVVPRMEHVTDFNAAIGDHGDVQTFAHRAGLDAGELFCWAVLEATELLAARWPALVRVSRALARRGQLHEREITALYYGVKPERRRGRLVVVDQIEVAPNIELALARRRRHCSGQRRPSGTA